MITYINPINVILFILFWTWFIAGYATFAALIDNPDTPSAKSDPLWMRMLMLWACLLIWPYPVTYKIMQDRKL